MLKIQVFSVYNLILDLKQKVYLFLIIIIISSMKLIINHGNIKK
jgi:hypothetical protein